MKKIIIDARMTKNSGIGVYTSNVISRLPKTEEFAFSLIGNSPELDKFQLPVEECAARIYGLREQIEIPSILGREKPDLFHCTHYNVPVFYCGKMAVTLYDLIHLLYPDFLPSKAAYLYACGMFRIAAAKADMIITISEYTKRDIMKRLGVKESRIRLIYPAVGHEFIPSEDSRREMRSAYGRYILYVGAIRGHKNVLTLAEAYCKLKKSGKIEQKLLVAGKSKSVYIERIKALISGCGLEKDFIHIENPDFETVKKLYRGADLFVFPSLYEGFGLPVLEAMASGCPVVTSNSSSLPEAAGDAALLVDPLDVEALSGSIRAVLADEILSNGLVRKGFERVKHFSWDRAAAQTLDVYRELL
jgi:glycosyltransferase involved in cell wall biosynthesis